MTHAFTAAQEQGEEMADAIMELSSERLAWLVLHCPEFKRLPEWSRGSVLLAELLRRTCDFDGLTPTATGWVDKNGSLIEYH